MDILIELSRFSIEIMKEILFIHFVVKYQFRDGLQYKIPIWITMEFIIIAVSMVLKAPSDFIDLCEVFFYMIITLIVFQGAIRKKIVVYFISLLAIAIIDVVIYFIITKIPNISPERFFESQVGMMLTELIGLMLLIVIALLRKKTKGIFEIPLKNLHWSKYALIIWTFICFTFLLGYIQIIQEESNTKLSNALTTVLILVSFGIINIVAMMSRASHTRDKYKAIAKMNQEYLEIQQNYYILLSEKNEDVKRFRHDLKNHFFCLQALVQEGRIDKITEYISDLSQDAKEVTDQIHTGSNVVDAIINDALDKNPQATITINGFLPNPLYISAVDLCTVFSNIITNAVEAISVLDDSINRTIDVCIKKMENKIYIRVTNPIKEKALIEHNIIGTTKSDKEMHGFGLGNIHKCVKKYHGTMELSSTKTEFTLEIVMKNEVIDRSLP